MSAREELQKTIKYWKEDKRNPSTAKLTISGETLIAIDAELAQMQARIAELETERRGVRKFINELKRDTDQVYIGYRYVTERLEKIQAVVLKQEARK